MQTSFLRLDVFRITIMFLFNCASVYFHIGHFTLKEWTNFPPTGDASLLGVLAERCLQQKQGNAAGEEEKYVRDEEHT